MSIVGILLARLAINLGEMARVFRFRRMAGSKQMEISN
jgi:hypothetical protein